jgi:hypothetical protein
VSAAAISVLLLVRDEVRDVEELLPTLRFAREVVVVWDPRGDRAARDAAERLGARVFERAFDGFGPQRQFALEQCTQDWVLWIDADERLDARMAAWLASGPPTEAGTWAYWLRRTSYFLGRRIRFCGWGGEDVLRLFRRASARFDDAPVHESVRYAGTAGGDRAEHRGFGLLHYSYRTREDCEAKLERYAQANAEKSFRAGRRAGAIDVALRPPLRFLRQYVLQLGFLDGVAGFELCRYAARQVARKYVLLAARTRAERAL